MTLRKLSSGEQVKIAHQDYNRWQDAGLANALGRLNQAGGIVLPDSQEGIILIQNTLDRALPRYSVLGVRGTVYDPRYSPQQSTEFQNQIALKGELPSSTTSGKFCVLQTDAAPGEVVPALVSGVTPVRLSITATTDQYADIETSAAIDKTKWLKSGGSGAAQILYQPEIVGEQWGVVRLSNRPVVQWALARFQAHASPDPVYAYPSRTASTQDRIFPAYKQNDVTWIDDPTDPSWSVTGIYTWTGTDKEAVFVQSLRNWWIPNQTELLPIFKVNGKWYCDYVKPAGPMFCVGDLISLGTSPTTMTFNPGVSTFFGGHSITCEPTTGVFTVHRTCTAHVSVSCTFRNVGAAPGDYYAYINTPSGTAYTTFQNATPDDMRQTASVTTAQDMGAGTTFSLSVQMNSTAGGRACDAFDTVVTIDTQNHF